MGGGITMQLALLCPAKSTAGQRRLFGLSAETAEAEHHQGLEVCDDGGVSVGPWGALLHFPHRAAPLGRYFGLPRILPGMGERVRQVDILTGESSLKCNWSGRDTAIASTARLSYGLPRQWMAGVLDG
ncbi:MAG: hypothetical protein HOY79_30275 [Streptomyces sp.]|nr:hypothetical protein [Streptomyces sp.]